MAYIQAMEVFEAVADPTRRRILDLLAEGECSAGELCEEFPVTRPAISRHLRVLRETGLVSCRVDAQRRMYRLEPEPLEEVVRWLSRYREHWSRSLDDLDAHLKRRRRRRK